MKSAKSILGIILLSIVVIFSSCKEEKSEPLTKWVDPFIGTGGHGHTYPGASVPFGMVQLSPDSRLTGWDEIGRAHV